MLSAGFVHVHKTASGTEILVQRGTKKESQYDFIVRYREPGGRPRTPKHIHPIVAMYVKHAHDSGLTIQLRDHMLEVFDKIPPATQFPPSLQVFRPSDAIPFASLDAVGEFSVEFLLVVTELIFIQEKTNYPQVRLHRSYKQTSGLRTNLQ